MHMSAKPRIEIPKDKISEFCKRNHIKKLSLFGSALRDDFNRNSDVDVIVEFEPEAHIGLIKLAALELELSKILGRNVDLNTPGFISGYYREKVLATADVQYDRT